MLLGIETAALRIWLVRRLGLPTLPCSTALGPWCNGQDMVNPAMDATSAVPDCLQDVFVGEVKNALNPLSPSLGTLGDATAETLSTWFYNQAVKHVSSRLLTYPMKSSIVRKLLGRSKTAAKAGFLLQVDLALLQGVIVEANKAWKGECKPGRFIF